MIFIECVLRQIFVQYHTLPILSLAYRQSTTLILITRHHRLFFHTAVYRAHRVMYRFKGIGAASNRLRGRNLGVFHRCNRRSYLSNFLALLQELSLTQSTIFEPFEKNSRGRCLFRGRKFVFFFSIIFGAASERPRKKNLRGSVACWGGYQGGGCCQKTDRDSGEKVVVTRPDV